MLEAQGDGAAARLVVRYHADVGDSPWVPAPAFLLLAPLKDSAPLHAARG